jgi:hypothetical protein
MPEIQQRHTIASYVASPSLAPGTRAALHRLGYELEPAVVHGRWEDASWSSDIRLVDERHIDRVPRDATPVVVLAGDPERQWNDERIIGAAPRPADVNALYPLLQRALEAQPRAAARAPAQITARGNIGDRRFDAQIVTLSQHGCLIRSEQSLDPGMQLNLAFALPLSDLMSLRGRVCRTDGEAVAVEFSTVDAAPRRAIADYVQRRLATA